MIIINYNPPPPPVLESDSSFEIVFHYDGAVITYLEEKEE
jgi:hypothetical protein